MILSRERKVLASIYFSANANGEAETVKVILKPKPRQKLLVFENDFSEHRDQRAWLYGEYPDKGGTIKVQPEAERKFDLGRPYGLV